ncbi:ABC transporter substrate-binding protein [Kosmotoga pacifica]|uniref:ABC transporter substrate-binding protein n=1 Tax=Kosmotoga pacifica TaxID=1330330 RepID=UPI00258BC0F4|nr:ABC transporter substrate-binding protein [Kosmotoga pacifica]
MNSVTLSWACNDPEGDSLVFDIYFGISSENMELIASDNPSNSFTIGELLMPDTTYYWKVVAKDGIHEVQSPVWTFTTNSHQPGTILIYPEPEGNIDYALVAGSSISGNLNFNNGGKNSINLSDFIPGDTYDVSVVIRETLNEQVKYFLWRGNITLPDEGICIFLENLTNTLSLELQDESGMEIAATSTVSLAFEISDYKYFTEIYGASYKDIKAIKNNLTSLISLTAIDNANHHVWYTQNLNMNDVTVLSLSDFGTLTFNIHADNFENSFIKLDPREKAVIWSGPFVDTEQATESTFTVTPDTLFKTFVVLRTAGYLYMSYDVGGVTVSNGTTADLNFFGMPIIELEGIPSDATNLQIPAGESGSLQGWIRDEFGNNITIKNRDWSNPSVTMQLIGPSDTVTLQTELTEQGFAFDNLTAPTEPGTYTLIIEIDANDYPNTQFSNSLKREITITVVPSESLTNGFVIVPDEGMRITRCTAQIIERYVGGGYEARSSGVNVGNLAINEPIIIDFDSFFTPFDQWDETCEYFMTIEESNGSESYAAIFYGTYTYPGKITLEASTLQNVFNISLLDKQGNPVSNSHNFTGILKFNSNIYPISLFEVNNPEKVKSNLETIDGLIFYDHTDKSVWFANGVGINGTLTLSLQNWGTIHVLIDGDFGTISPGISTWGADHRFWYPEGTLEAQISVMPGDFFVVDFQEDDNFRCGIWQWVTVGANDEATIYAYGTPKVVFEGIDNAAISSESIGSNINIWIEDAYGHRLEVLDKNNNWAGIEGRLTIQGSDGSTVYDQTKRAEGTDYHFDNLPSLESGEYIIRFETTLPDIYPVSAFAGQTLSREITITIAPPEEVTFPDPNLEQAIREVLGKEVGEPIYNTDLAGIHELNLEDRGISNLGGLEYCTNLEALFVSRNQITDLTPIMNLPNLRTLFVGWNPISDISQLQNLSQLENIGIEGLNLGNEDVLFLANFVNLRSLCINVNNLTDISFITSMTQLEYLNIEDNNITDISVLPSLQNLHGVSLGRNPLSSIEPIKNMTWLENLALVGLGLTNSDIQFLQNFSNLKWLWLNENQGISDLTPLQNLNLYLLDIGGCSVSDLSPLAGHTNLENLWAWGNSITDLSPLQNLPNLREIDLNGNAIQDITPLVNNPGLGEGDWINLENNYLDLTPGSDDMNNIQALIDRGVNVRYEPQNALPPSPPDDWNLLGTDPTDVSTPSMDIVEVSYAETADLLFFKVRAAGQWQDLSEEFIVIGLDTDLSTQTGVNAYNPNIGVDYVIIAITGSSEPWVGEAPNDGTIGFIPIGSPIYIEGNTNSDTLIVGVEKSLIGYSGQETRLVVTTVENPNSPVLVDSAPNIDSLPGYFTIGLPLVAGDWNNWTPTESDRMILKDGLYTFELPVASITFLPGSLGNIGWYTVYSSVSGSKIPIWKENLGDATSITIYASPSLMSEGDAIGIGDSEKETGDWYCAGEFNNWTLSKMEKVGEKYILRISINVDEGDSYYYKIARGTDWRPYEEQFDGKDYDAGYQEDAYFVAGQAGNLLVIEYYPKLSILSAHVETDPTYPPDDWMLLGTDPTDVSSPSVDIVEVSYAENIDYLYFKVKAAGQWQDFSDHALIILLDTDSSTLTGFNAFNPEIGADYAFIFSPDSTSSVVYALSEESGTELGGPAYVEGLTNSDTVIIGVSKSVIKYAGQEVRVIAVTGTEDALLDFAPDSGYFTIGNQPPEEPYIIQDGLSVTDGATGVPLTPALCWDSSDPDGDTIVYDVYYGTSPENMQLYLSNYTEKISMSGDLIGYAIINPALEPSTTYYWKVVAKDGKGGITEGPIWSFTTTSNSVVLPTDWTLLGQDTLDDSPSGYGINEIYYGETSDYLFFKVIYDDNWDVALEKFGTYVLLDTSYPATPPEYQDFIAEMDISPDYFFVFGVVNYYATFDFSYFSGLDYITGIYNSNQIIVGIEKSKMNYTGDPLSVEIWQVGLDETLLDEAPNTGYYVVNPPETEYVIEDSNGIAGGTLYLGLPNAPSTLNPYWVQNSSSQEIVKWFCDSLLNADDEEMPTIPALAADWWFSEDGKTVFFSIRNGVFWSDGVPFTVEDVYFTFTRVALVEGMTASGPGGVLDANGQLPIVEIVDENTISFTWTAPNVWGFKWVAYSSILPKHICEEAVDNGTFSGTWSVGDIENIVGTGPFIPVSISESTVVLERNPFYYRKDINGVLLPYLDRIEYKITTDMYNDFQNGEIDIYNPTAEEFPGIEEQAEEKGWVVGVGGPALGSQFIAFNWVNSDPAKREWFRNEHFRKAFVYMLDRQTIIDELYNGLGTPIYGPVSPSSGFYNPEVESFGYEYSLEKAREELELGGFTLTPDGTLVDASGTAVEFELITNAGNTIRETIGNDIVSKAASLGIKINFNAIDFDTVVQKLLAPDYEAVIIGLSGSTDPGSGWNVWRLDGGLHFWNYSPELRPDTVPEDIWWSPDWEQRIDEIFRLQTSVVDPGERYNLFAEFQMICAEHQPLIYTVTQNYLYAHKDTVHLANPEPNPAAGILWKGYCIWKSE